MCGIIGAASSRSVGKILIKGLQLMEYRGYDSAGVVLNKDEEILRRIIREALTKSDKAEIEKIAKRQAQKYLDKEITSAIEKELGRSFLGPRGKISKHVDDAITARFKNANKDKDFDDSVIKVAKRVVKALHDMHYKRSNLVDSMPVPKN